MSACSLHNVHCATFADAYSAQVRLPRASDHRITIRQHQGRELVGGVTVSVRVLHPLRVRFVGDTHRRRVHAAFCPAVKKVAQKYRAAFGAAEEAMSWGYSLCDCARAMTALHD